MPSRVLRRNARDGDCLFFDLFPFSENGLVAAEVDVGWRDIVEALVLALDVIVVNEGPDMAFKIPG